MEVVRAIARTQRDTRDRPLDDIVLERVEVEAESGTD